MRRDRVFTFAENRTRLLRAPLYAVLSAVALVFPRDRDLWVFGRRNGVGEGPLAVYQAARESGARLRLVWIAQSEEQRVYATSLGIESYSVTSWRARWLTLRAGVLVLAYGLGDVVRPFAPGAHVVQTWHGAPLKRIRLDSPVSLGQTPFGFVGAAIFAALFRLSGRVINTIPASSPIVAERFCSAWGWSDQSRIATLGDPRCDILTRVTPERHAEARAMLQELWGGAPLPAHLVLYAPTWRDGNAGPSLTYADLTEANVRLLAEADAWLVMRSHPWGLFTSEAEQIDHSVPVRFASPDDINDINAILCAFDVLVSDYSAISIDYSVLDRPQVFYAPDLVEYTASRGLYEDYDLFTGGCHHDTWAHVLEEVRDVLVDVRSRTTNIARTSSQLRARYHSNLDGHAALRLVDHVRRRTHRPGVL